ncbi:MAG: hypothetical protein HY422_02445, partial [Candidatus Komeilibacteria bacterium]|nr:hypothetical protein [Candidatus Komeilibacteria bacterium]
QQNSVPTIRQSGGARLLAWSIDGKEEFSVFVPFNRETFTFVDRAFKAFDVAYASGAYDVGFDNEFTVNIEFHNQTVTARAHITRYDDATPRTIGDWYDSAPRLWFEFRAFNTLCFSDSLSLNDIR